MSRIKRKLILAFLITTFVFSSGCASNSNSNEEDPAVQLLLTESFYAGTIHHYRVGFSRPAAELLGSVLVKSVTIETVTSTLTKMSKNPLPAQLKLLALIIVADVLLFKYTLEKNMGPHGAIIDIWGPPLILTGGSELQSPALCLSKFVDLNTNLDYCISLTDKGIKKEIVIMIPDNYKLDLEQLIGNLDAALTIINTIPVYWKIEPRK